MAWACHWAGASRSVLGLALGWEAGGGASARACHWAGAFRSVDHLMLPLATTGNRVGMLIGAAIYRPFALGERQRLDAKPLRWPGLVNLEAGPETDSAA